MSFWSLVKDIFYWFRNFEVWVKALANINLNINIFFSGFFFTVGYEILTTVPYALQ